MKTLNKKLGGTKYLLFLDLEGTQYTHEVISIGAYLAKLTRAGTTGPTKKGFYILVKSREKISKFITEFTGITNSMVEKDGVSFDEAMIRLRKYIGGSLKHTRMVTYGASDLGMLRSSINNAPYNEKSDEFVETLCKTNLDFQAFSTQYMKDDKNNVLSLQNSIKKFSLEFEGNQHNALADAKNLQNLYDSFQSKYDIVINEYKKVLQQNKKLPRAVARVLKSLQDGQTVTPDFYNELIEDEVRD